MLHRDVVASGPGGNGGEQTAEMCANIWAEGVPSSGMEEQGLSVESVIGWVRNRGLGSVPGARSW